MAQRSRRTLWVCLLLAAGALLLYRHFDLGRLLTLDTLKASRDTLVAAYEAQPLFTAAAFFGFYVLAAALSVPGATILTLAAGAMFGLGVGLVIVSFACRLGALLAFLAARYLLRDAVQSRFGKQLAPVNDGMRRDGMLFLLTLRLVPVFPFCLVNLLAGLTPIGAARFYGVSQLGMLASTVVYVNAGTQLAAIQRPADVLSPGLLASFVLLVLPPIPGLAAVGCLTSDTVWDLTECPRRLVVLGGGPIGCELAQSFEIGRAHV